MKLREQIIVVADRYSELVGLGRKRVSTIVLGRGSKLDDIADGGDLVTATYEKALVWFSENWPCDAEWPIEVPRPVLTAEAAE